MAHNQAEVMVFTFRRMVVEDLPRLHGWLQTPHVREFYHREPRTLDAVAEHYLGRIRGDDPTHPFIAYEADVAIGYMQTYRIADHPTYAAQVRVEADAAGVDMLIGEAAYAHRGLGAPLLRRFVDDVVWTLTGARTCWIGPSVDNRPAIRAYEKAGFVYAKTVQIADEDTPEYLMKLTRTDAPSRAP